jgi:anti-anti-sigma factor
VEITSQTKDGVAFLTLSGRMMFDESLFGLSGHVSRLLAAGLRKFVVDLAAVPYCDSSGCGEVIAVYATIRKMGGIIAFACLGEKVHLLWTRVKLTDVFPI